MAGKGAVREVQEAVPTSAGDVRRDAEGGRGWYAAVARGGLVAKGLSYGIVGILALRLAVGDGGQATSRQGALQTLAQESFGKVALALLALGFAGYALWRFVEAVVGPGGDGASEWAKRAGCVGRGLIYAGLTYTSLKILIGAGAGGSQEEQADRTTATVLAWPGGRWIVGLAGLAIVGAGVWNAYRGLWKKFEKNWRTGAMGAGARRWGRRVGLAGHLARALVFGLIGVFVVKAALEYSAEQATGLDGALRKLAAADHGPYLLGFTAAGLVCYGLYCLVDARYRDVSAGD